MREVGSIYRYLLGVSIFHVHQVYQLVPTEFTIQIFNGIICFFCHLIHLYSVLKYLSLIGCLKHT